MRRRRRLRWFRMNPTAPDISMIAATQPMPNSKLNHFLDFERGLEAKGDTAVEMDVATSCTDIQAQALETWNARYWEGVSGHRAEDTRLSVGAVGSDVAVALFLDLAGIL